MIKDSGLFDPLKYLEHDLRLNVKLDKNGQIVLYGISWLGEEWRKKAVWVLRTYDKLLKIQLSDPKRPSVYKLFAQEKIKIRKGQFVRMS